MLPSSLRRSYTAKVGRLSGGNDRASTTSYGTRNMNLPRTLGDSGTKGCMGPRRMNTSQKLPVGRSACANRTSAMT